MRKVALSCCFAAVLSVLNADVLPTKGKAQAMFKGQSWQRLIGGFGGCEGAQWLSDNQGSYLLFAAHHDHLVFKWRPSEGLNLFRSGSPEGTSFRPDSDGNLVVVEQATRRLAKWSPNGETLEVLADEFQGKKLNRPNDSRIDAQGRVWFTDPDFLFKKRPHEKKEQAGQYVYCYDPSTSKLTAPIQDLNLPNGIAISQDGKTLYVADSKVGTIFKYTLGKNGIEGKGVPFYKNPERRIDGLTVDTKGNFWFCSKTSLVMLNDQAKEVGRVELPGMPTSLDFSKDGWVCVTLRDSAYVVKLNQKNS